MTARRVSLVAGPIAVGVLTVALVLASGGRPARGTAAASAATAVAVRTTSVEIENLATPEQRFLFDMDVFKTMLRQHRCHFQQQRLCQCPKRDLDPRSRRYHHWHGKFFSRIGCFAGFFRRYLQPGAGFQHLRSGQLLGERRDVK